MTLSKVGLHVIPIALEGQTEELVDHARRMNGACHKFLDPLSDKTLFRRLFDVTPQSEWVLRNHQRSEDKGTLLTHPASLGQRHANEWANELSALGLAGDPRVLVEGVNEWIPNSPAAAAAISAYSLAFLTRLTALGIRGLAPMFSVGWPDGPNGIADWTPYLPVLEYIKSHPQHGLGLHEYWPGPGPQEGWGYLAGRLMHVPVKGLPVYITECGNDNVIGNGKLGWKDWGLTPQQIASQVLDYTRRLGELGFVIKGIHPFTTGGASEWGSFYMQGEPNRLLAEAAQSAPTPPPTPVPPTPTPPTPPAPPTGGTVTIHPDVQDPTFPDVYYRVKPAANKQGGYYRVKELKAEVSGDVIVIGHVTSGPVRFWHFRWPDGDVRSGHGEACAMGPGAKFTTPDGGPHWCYGGDDPAKSEHVTNIGLPAGNHRVFRLTWEWVPETPPAPPPTPTPPAPDPTPTPTPTPPSVGGVEEQAEKLRWFGEAIMRAIEKKDYAEAHRLLATDFMPRAYALENHLKGRK